MLFRSDRKNQEAYVDKIRHETLRISVIERLESYFGIQGQTCPQESVTVSEEEYNANLSDTFFEPFKDLCKRRFLWYYESYQRAIQEGMKKHKANQPFEKMPFEGPGNVMDGKFQYPSLLERLETIYTQLLDEQVSWAMEGRQAVQKEMSIASNLQRQFEQIVEHYKKNDAIALDLDLVDKNPCVWLLVLFGRPMTNLEGGLFRIFIYISPRFPDVLPRVRFETPIFHHRVSPKGDLCYDATRKDDMKSHIEAIIEAIEEESPAYDPRTLVNMEAANLFWGKAGDRKMYNRRLRRSVQETADC